MAQDLSSEKLAFTIKNGTTVAAYEVCAEEPRTADMIRSETHTLSVPTCCTQSRMGLDEGHAWF